MSVDQNSKIGSPESDQHYNLTLICGKDEKVVHVSPEENIGELEKKAIEKFSIRLDNEFNIAVLKDDNTGLVKLDANKPVGSCLRKGDYVNVHRVKKNPKDKNVNSIYDILKLQYPSSREKLAPTDCFNNESSEAKLYLFQDESKPSIGKYISGVEDKDDDEVFTNKEKIKETINKWKLNDCELTKFRDPEDECYKTIKGVKGPFIIFNYKHFYDTQLSNRQGANELALKLAETAVFLGFSPVRIFNDLTKKETEDWLDRFAKASYENVNCLGVGISSHGTNSEKIYASDGGVLHLDQYYNSFGGENCKDVYLPTQPKLIFIQACRGNAKEQVTYGDEFDAGPTITTVPKESNFMFAHSTTQGKASFRRPFFTSLCENIKKHAGKEIMGIMRKVNLDMAEKEFPESKKRKMEESSSYGEKKQKFKQMPSITYRLTKALYFGNKNSGVEA